MLFLILIAGAGLSCTAEQATPTPTPARVAYYTYEAIAEYPHDPDAFTQGLTIGDGRLYESTGLYGNSTLRQVDLETGAVEQVVHLPRDYFGEGMTIYGETIVQLTWRENIGFVYDLESFRRVDEFSYDTEGWGLTYDGSNLIMSDGTSRLYFLDPTEFEVLRTIEVKDGVEPVVRLNELEYIGNEVYANVWQTDRIARIDPETGQVTGWVDLTGLLSPEDASRADCLNGIAYDSAANRLYVTGKLWPSLFQIELVPLK